MSLCEMHVVGCQLKEKHAKSHFLGVEVKLMVLLSFSQIFSPLLYVSDSKILA